MEKHGQHSDPNGTYNPADVLYGPLPDMDEWKSGHREASVNLLWSNSRFITIH